MATTTANNGIGGSLRFPRFASTHRLRLGVYSQRVSLTNWMFALTRKFEPTVSFTHRLFRSCTNFEPQHRAESKQSNQWRPLYTIIHNYIRRSRTTMGDNRPNRPARPRPYHHHRTSLTSLSASA